jgi:hypothetical protein
MEAPDPSASTVRASLTERLRSATLHDVDERTVLIAVVVFALTGEIARPLPVMKIANFKAERAGDCLDLTTCVTLEDHPSVAIGD